MEYEDHSKLYIPKIRTCDNYRNYLNIAMPSDEESGDEPIQEEFLRSDILLPSVLLTPDCPASHLRTRHTRGRSGPRSWN